jgi:hypothetical protein
MVLGYPSYSGEIQLIYAGLQYRQDLIKIKNNKKYTTNKAYMNSVAIWGKQNQPSVTNMPCPI